MATLEDVAKAAGVSRNTAALALLEPERVNQEVRQRVLDAAEKLRYAPYDPANRFNEQPQLYRITIITSADATRGLGSVIITAAASALGEEGYAISYLTLNPHSTMPVPSEEVDGYLIVGGNVQMLPLLHGLLDQQKPMVCVESDLAAALGMQEVCNDAESGIYNATSHLILAGYRQIALLNLSLESNIGRAVWQGFRRIMSEQNISLPVRLLLEGDGSAASGFSALQALLLQPPLPQALVCACDEMAFGAMQAISAAGLRIPDNVAVVGMGDVEASAYTQPGLTTVRVNSARIGQTAATTLMQRIQGSYQGEERVLVPNSLVVRDSCGSTRARPHQTILPPRFRRTPPTPARVIPMSARPTRRLETPQ